MVRPLSLTLNFIFYYRDTGDVQPYLALGTRLKQDGHRVRIATHETFRSFVTDAGLEFFNIGGNPQDLMSYMVKSEFMNSLIRQMPLKVCI